MTNNPIWSTKTELRTNSREVFVDGELPEVCVRLEESDIEYSASIVDISIDGVGLACSELDGSVVGKAVRIGLFQNREISIDGEIVGLQSFEYLGFQSCRVRVKFIRQAREQVRARRFPVAKALESMCIAKHPFKPSQVAQYGILDISADGLCLLTTNVGDLLLPGVKIRLSTYLMGSGIHETDVLVVNIRKGLGSSLLMGCRFIDASPSFLLSIPVFLLMTGQKTFSVADLRQSGFYVGPDVTYALRTRFVSTEEQWREYLKLRLLAQQQAGRWLDEVDIYRTIDKYDKSSRHMTVMAGDSIVAIGRLVFHGTNIENAEHASLANIPEHIQREGFIEASRFATHPGFRKTNIFINLIKTGFRVAILTNTKWIIANCEDSLVPIYKRFGAFELNQTFHTNFMGSTRLNLIAFNVPALCRRRGIRILYWHVMFSELIGIAKDRGYAKIPRTSLFLAKIIAKCLKYLENIKQIKAKKMAASTRLDYLSSLQNSTSASRNETKMEQLPKRS